YPEVDLMVGHDGALSTACACPLSQGCRDATRELWHRYASLEPHVLWVEDDIRLLNHPPITYGCFCPLHMKEFSRRVGREVAREELVAALLAPGKPHPYRRIWLDTNREVMIDLASFLEKCVHEVSPNTRLGLMCSSPTSHAIEGRDWKPMTAALAGDKPLHVRPCMFNYAEESARGLYEAEYYFRATQHCVGSDAIIQTEIENVPFSTYSKSAKFTFLQIALSYIFGADAVTLSIFDHMGTPIELTPEFGNMLRDRKPYFEGLAERCRGGDAAGVQLIHHFDGSYFTQLNEGDSHLSLSAEGHGWRKVLEPLGIPITYNESSIVALSGQVVRALSADQIRKLLSGGVILDLTAVRCLLQMGYGEHIGVSIRREFRKYDEPLAAEEYFNTEFGGSDNAYLTLTLPDLGGDALMAKFEPASNAAIVSRMVDLDVQLKYPFLVLYENSLGGRVATYPIDIEYCAGPAFLNPWRKKQCDVLVDWLSQNKVPLVVNGGVYPLPFRIDQEGYTVVGAFNLSMDDWPKVSFRLHSGGRKPSRIECIDPDGVWREERTATWRIEQDIVEVELRKAFPAHFIAALIIRW
ncbi:MAG: hypothetical protein M1305_07735, partial [Candidatus Marsarchaeota archaeon]|nr:hypothetical protein [Candidatus Marsarchaeota archaeon]